MNLTIVKNLILPNLKRSGLRKKYNKNSTDFLINNLRLFIIKLENIKNALIKTGADEIPLGLISRAIAQNENIKISPIYTYENSKNLISNISFLLIFRCPNLL